MSLIGTVHAIDPYRFDSKQLIGLFQSSQIHFREPPNAEHFLKIEILERQFPSVHQILRDGVLFTEIYFKLLMTNSMVAILRDFSDRPCHFLIRVQHVPP